MSNDIPALQIDFWLNCQVSDSEASILRSEQYQISPEGQDYISQRLFEAPLYGSDDDPCVILEMSLKLYGDDEELFEEQNEQFFKELAENAALISRWKDSDVMAEFRVNFNSTVESENLAFYLSSDKIELLANLGASINFEAEIFD